MRCENCGAHVNPEHKYCEYCKVVANPNGKDNDFVSVECFVVEDIFTVMKNSIIVGKALQPLKVGDAVCYGDSKYLITNMQAGRKVVNSISGGDNCGIVLSGFKKNDFGRGAVLFSAKN